MTTGIAIKKGISALMSACGLFSILESYRVADRAFILMYHRVLRHVDPHGINVQPGMYVTSRTFERQISFLASTHQILPLEELIGKANRNESMGGCCAITFDDGWRDNYTEAFPLLEKYRVPATVFLATSFIGTNRLFWPEEICWLLEHQHTLKNKPVDDPVAVQIFKREIKEYRSETRDKFLDNIITSMKRRSPVERNQVLDYYRKCSTGSDISRQMLNWEEVDEMQSSGLITFGAHTVKHELLDQLPLSDVRTEIFQSKTDIEQKLGVNVTTFSYPNGNYTEDIVKMLNEFDFAGAVTTRKGFLGHQTPRMEIPRIAIHEDISGTIPMLQGRILLETF